MKYFKTLCSFVVFLLSVNVYSQVKNNRITLGRSHAENELKITLANEKNDNVINNESLLIKSKDLAVKIAEPILFDIYGRHNIIEERPYEIFLIDKYWVISGTIPLNSKGGTFLIIIDARNAKIMRIIHGK